MRALIVSFMVVGLACDSTQPAEKTAEKTATPEKAATPPPEVKAPPPEAKSAQIEKLPAIDCKRPEEHGPIHLTAEQLGKRNGTGVTTLAAFNTSMERPVEVCDVGGENQWLVASRCADGSAPIKSGLDAMTARQGSVGAGGRCGSILDHYKVACPEQDYDVYIDMYMCPEGTSFR